MSKLYTKEMFLIAAEKCEVSMIDARHIMQYIDEYGTSIGTRQQGISYNVGYMTSSGLNSNNLSK